MSISDLAFALETPQQRLEFARKVMKSWKLWVKPDFPERPPMSGNDDEIERWMEVLERGGALQRHELEMFRTFSAWRSAVWKLEQQSISKAYMVLRAATYFEECGEIEESRRARRFLLRYYKTPGPKVLSEARVRASAEMAGRDLVALPKRLRFAGSR